jgi:hypothetical protein
MSPNLREQAIHSLGKPAHRLLHSAHDLLEHGLDTESAGSSGRCAGVGVVVERVARETKSR